MGTMQSPITKSLNRPEGDATMKKPLILAVLLSASAALAACDRADDPASMTGAPAATGDGSVTMPSPAPQNTAPMDAAPATTPAPAAGGTTGTMSQ